MTGKTILQCYVVILTYTVLVSHPDQQVHHGWVIQVSTKINCSPIALKALYVNFKRTVKTCLTSVLQNNDIYGLN